MCKMHQTCRVNHGPHRYALKQLGYRQNKALTDLNTPYNTELNEIEVSLRGEELENAVRALNARLDTDRFVINEDFKLQRNRLIADYRHTIEATGFDSDAEARGRRAEEGRHRRALLELRMQARRGGVHWQVIDLQDDIDDIAEIVAVEPAEERRLADIAADPQGVHTSEVVKNVLKIVDGIRKVPVPDGYKWDKKICSKTPGEIITECRLTQSAAWQMMSQYAQDTAIYNIEEGIYGKVLDSVWQFIKTNAEKDSLVAILRTELEDNIGMCAQGNLTRICNILAGYLDGIGPLESLSERLGRLIPPLRDIANRDERHTRVLDILRDNSAPPDQWDAWIEAAME
jgi:hypothetical protein